MNGAIDFVIEDGVLKKYRGSGGNVIIPDSVTSIGYSAFQGCPKIQWIRSPLMLSHSQATGCSCALLLSGKNSAWFAYTSKETQDNLSDFAKSGSWSRYDLELINNGPIYKYRLPVRIIGALGRLIDPVELTDENRALLTELVAKNAKKLVSLAEETGKGKIIEALFSLNILDSKTAKAIKKAAGGIFCAGDCRAGPVGDGRSRLRDGQSDNAPKSAASGIRFKAQSNQGRRGLQKDETAWQRPARGETCGRRGSPGGTVPLPVSAR